MTIYFASDHGGFALKAALQQALAARSIAFKDLGCDSDQSCDYPQFAHALAEQIQADPDSKGVAICGTGLGISMALNRHAGVRAARCVSVSDAELAREHNDANVLVLGGRITEPALALAMLDKFLETAFAGGRHAARVRGIEL